MVYQLASMTCNFSGVPQQWRHMTAAMDNGKRLELAQIETNKNYETNLIPLHIYTQKLYCMLVMIACFVCALFSFNACNFPAKSKTQEPGKLLRTEPRMCFHDMVFYQ